MVNEMGQSGDKWGEWVFTLEVADQNGENTLNSMWRLKLKEEDRDRLVKQLRVALDNVLKSQA